MPILRVVESSHQRIPLTLSTQLVLILVYKHVRLLQLPPQVFQQQRADQLAQKKPDFESYRAIMEYTVKFDFRIVVAMVLKGFVTDVSCNLYTLNQVFLQNQRSSHHVDLKFSLGLLVVFLRPLVFQFHLNLLFLSSVVIEILKNFFQL